MIIVLELVYHISLVVLELFTPKANIEMEEILIAYGTIILTKLTKTE